MRKTAKCFWLYAGSMVLAGVAFFLLERFDAGKAWSLTLLPTCALAWVGLAVWRISRGSGRQVLPGYSARTGFCMACLSD